MKTGGGAPGRDAEQGVGFPVRERPGSGEARHWLTGDAISRVVSGS